MSFSNALILNWSTEEIYEIYIELIPKLTLLLLI